MKQQLAAILAGMALAAAVQAAEPIRFGLVDETTGPQAEAGVLTVNGARLAQEEINKAGGILGRPLELRVEDNQSTNPGTVLAYSKLTSEGGITAVIGPLRSTQTQAASPTIARAGLPALIGGSDPSLTKVNNRWIFRVRPNDTYSARVIADFGVNTLKHRKWAIVHSTDTFGTGGKNELVKDLQALGAEVVLVQGFTANSQDFTPIALAIKKSGAEVLGSYIANSNDVGILARQLRQLGVTIPWVGSASNVTDTALKLAGDALWGTYSVADFSPYTNEVSARFAKAYKEKFGQDADIFCSWSYAAVYLLKHAIEKAGSTDPEAIRSALLATRGLKGVEGTYDFDRNGDGVHGYNVMRNDKGKVVFVKRVDFPAE